MNQLFSQTEEEILKIWQEKQIFKKSLEQRQNSPLYSFFDGPPFATGLPHYGHILASTIKDVVGRYWTMRDYYVPRRWGWDCHGLPIETIIEKELGISGKKQIEEKGVEVFNQACRRGVLTYAQEWQKTVDRIGRFVDFENSYKTMDSTYMESVWWAIKEIWKKDLIYQGRKVLLYCPRCETPISNFEVAMDNNYQEVTEDTVVVKFRLAQDDRFPDQTFLLAWTTTPWTLPENVAVAVNPTIEYVLAKKAGEHFILAKDLISLDPELEVEKTFAGQDLVGLKYQPLYGHDQEKAQGAFQVYPGDFVSIEEGTGLVHIATGYGEDDYNLGLANKLPIFDSLNEQGIFTDQASAFLQGVYFKQANPLVIEDLTKRDLLFKTKTHSHQYPFCWRCQTTLYYKAIPAWFINIQKIKPRLLELNQNINWYPSYLKDGRFKNGLENAPDWNISRNRYWATAIPIWICDQCEHQECIGSVSELIEKATNFSQVYQTAELEKLDLHKPYIDEIKLKCPKCHSEMSRIKEVIDCWVESASMPFAEIHYPFENQETFKKRFPAQFVAEYISQTRAWFYVMHVISTILFDQAPFENVVTTGIILNEKGEKMSKSKKNYPDPWAIIEQYGADTLRFYLMSSSVMKADNLFFSEKGVAEKYKKVVLILQNINSFYQLYQTGELLTELPKELNNIHLLDNWFISYLEKSTKEITQAFDSYDTVSACRLLEEVIDTLSTWYLRRSRERFKAGDKEGIKYFSFFLYRLAILLAPITPFLAEYLYQSLNGPKESVHLEDWPEINPNLIDEHLNKDMDRARKYASLGLAARMVKPIKVRQPLESLELNDVQSLDNTIEDLIKEEVNVKDCHYHPSLDEFENKPEAFIIKEENDLKVALDIRITDELQREGWIRELTRQINELRKKQGLTIADRVKITYTSIDPDLTSSIAQFKELILKQTLSTELTKTEQQESMVEMRIDNKSLWLTLIK